MTEMSASASLITFLRQRRDVSSGQSDAEIAPPPLMFSVEDQRIGKHLPHARPNLASLAAVRREMARVYRAVKAGRIPSQDATRLCYILTQIGRTLELERAEREAAKAGAGAQAEPFGDRRSHTTVSLDRWLAEIRAKRDRESNSLTEEEIDAPATERPA